MEDQYSTNKATLEEYKLKGTLEDRTISNDSMRKNVLNNEFNPRTNVYGGVETNINPLNKVSENNASNINPVTGGNYSLNFRGVDKNIHRGLYLEELGMLSNGITKMDTGKTLPDYLHLKAVLGTMDKDPNLKETIDKYKILIDEFKVKGQDISIINNNSILEKMLLSSQEQLGELMSIDYIQKEENMLANKEVSKFSLKKHF